MCVERGAPLCVTLERNWCENAVGKSCIPVGKYQVVPYSGVRFKRCFAVKSVPRRSGILIHAGNTLVDTSGCILVGQGLSDYGIVQSRAALDELFRRFPDGFDLEVIKC